jgi:peptidoglycan hydrolase CwlO-like protein
VKKRIEKLETILEVSNIEKIREDVHEMDKEQATISEKIDSLDAKIDSLDNKIDLKFDSLRTEMNERFNTTNEKINTTNEKINSVRTELRITLGLILTGIVAIIIKLFI